MSIRVLEHEGVYTAHRLVVRRNDAGKLYESLKRIPLAYPPPDEDKWPNWAQSLSEDELDIGLQIFFDRWNFGTGSDGDGRVYSCLYDERERRREENEHPMVVVDTKPIRVRG